MMGAEAIKKRALPLFPAAFIISALRIRNEEDVLRRDLPGYSDYCKKIRYRLVPFIW